MISSDPIPTTEKYRGVGIHADQSPARIEPVKAEIDQVLGLSELGDLFEYALDCGHAPEARQLSSALVEARWQVAVNERRQRPDIDLDVLHASTAALGGQYWRDPDRYGTLLCHGAVKRELPLKDR